MSLEQRAQAKRLAQRLAEVDAELSERQRGRRPPGAHDEGRAMSATYGLRVLPTYPWDPRAVGRVHPISGTLQDVEDMRRAMPNGHHYEIVTLADLEGPQ